MSVPRDVFIRLSPADVAGLEASGPPHQIETRTGPMPQDAFMLISAGLGALHSLVFRERSPVTLATHMEVGFEYDPLS